MNSILQCLSNTRELRDYCLQRLYLRDLSHSSRAHTALMEGEGLALDTFPRYCRSRGLHASLPFLFLWLLSVGTLQNRENGSAILHTPLYPFLLPIEFAKLIQTIWTSSPNDVVSPSEFKTQIQRYAPRFVGYK